MLRTCAAACVLVGCLGAVAAADDGGDANGTALPSGAVARLASTFLRHAGSVNAVAVSPDSKAVASVGEDGAVCVWDVATGRRTFHLKTDGAPRDVAFGPDGTTLAYVQQAAQVTVLSLQGSQPPRGFAIARDVPMAKFSRNGAIVVSYWKGGLAVARVSDGNGLGQVESTGQPLGLVVSPQGDFLVTITFNARGGGLETKRWDVPLRKARWTIISRNVAAAVPRAISPDGRFLAALANDGNIVLMDANTGARLWSFVPEGERTALLEFLPAGRLIGATAESLSVWDANSGKRVAQADANATAFPGQNISGLTASPDGSFVATAGPWHMVGLWNARTCNLLFDLHGHAGPIAGVAFGRGGARIVSASHDGTVRKWGADGADTLVASLHDAYSQWLAVAPGGKWAASQSSFPRPSITVWDLDKGRPACSLDPGESAYSAAFSPDGQFLATGGIQWIRVWHVVSGRLCSQIDTQQNEQAITALAFSADGRMVAAGGSDCVRVFETATGLEAMKFGIYGEPARSLAFSPDGRILLAAAKGDFTCYDLRFPQITGGLWGSGHLRFRWDDEGEKEKEKEKNRKKENEISGLGEMGSAVAFSADGRKVAMGGDDSSILIWHAPRPEPVPATQPAEANELADLWETLASKDAAKAFTAAQRLIAQGPAAVALLKGRLAPLPPSAGPVDANKLLADLDSDSYRVREDASRKLAEIGDAGRLEEALEKAKSDEVRMRLQDVLANQASPAAADRTQLRYGRALRVLELIGDGPAREVLSRLAEGGPGRLTRDASAALARLKSVEPTGAATTRPKKDE
jgi:WD40 repeat protein